MNLNLSDFIYTRDNALTPEFCQQVIDKFDSDSRSAKGMIGPDENVRVDLNVKDSLDLLISDLPGWKSEDLVFFDSLNYHIKEYLSFNWLPEEVPDLYLSSITDSGYQIQKTSPGAGYIWHDDDQFGEYVKKHGARWATYIWYLNDVKEDGCTEFVDGTKVQPEAGKILIFPACWPFIHRGYPPKSEVKYIVTGWMHAL